MKLNRHLLALAALAALAAGPAQAITFTGDTTDAPLWDRPYEDLSGLSGLGIGVNYDVFEFSVSKAGDYTFLSTATDNSNGFRFWDNFTFLYKGSFDPEKQLSHAVIGNDDDPVADVSGFTTSLSVGRKYFFVTTGFDRAEFGAYTNSITGPGLVNAVPEPATWALMAFGLAGVAASARRRHA